MEDVRWEATLGAAFSREEFERAFARFAELYNVRPASVRCAPDVLARFCALFERSADDAHRQTRLVHLGLPLSAAVLAPGTIVFDGKVDEDRMGDW